MRISINQTVKVKLTPEGIDFLTKSGYTHKNENGYMVTQLWDLMNIFGSEMMQHKKPVFEHNIIEFIDIEKEDLEARVTSLERQINFISESVNVLRHSIETQDDTLRTVDDTLRIQKESMKTLADILNKLIGQV